MKPAAELIYSVASTACTLTLVLAGELDLATSAELRRKLVDLVESGRAPVVVVDLSEVCFIDAAAVGVIVGVRAVAAARGRQLYVDGLRGNPARVFEILALDWLRLSDPGRPLRLSPERAGGRP
jgi:anti-anti-sigma factor